LKRQDIVRYFQPTPTMAQLKPTLLTHAVALSTITSCCLPINGVNNAMNAAHKYKRVESMNQLASTLRL
jgi:hypothetical protein